MDKCCILSSTSPRPQRRINGFELPLNYQQVIGWLVLGGTALVNFIFLVQIQFRELQIIALIVYTVLYVSHILSHLTASLMDPSEKELRIRDVNNVPEFDRSIHAHVIENGRCHLCNVYTSSRNTKHCSICNKCVDHFDHHCKWLNNCVGRRNYIPFILCVTTALMISAFTSCLCLTDIVLFLTNPQKLSGAGQHFINCTSLKDPSMNYCKVSMSFLAFLVVFCLIALGIACALLHLCCFHVYISVLGVSTYEYVVKSSPEALLFRCISCKCCKMNQSNLQIKKATLKNKSYAENSGKGKADNVVEMTETPHQNENRNVANLIILINNELDRAKKIFVFDKNKVHPHGGDISR